jgi:hypothetical protein
MTQAAQGRGEIGVAMARGGGLRSLRLSGRDRRPRNAKNMRKLAKTFFKDHPREVARVGGIKSLQSRSSETIARFTAGFFIPWLKNSRLSQHLASNKALSFGPFRIAAPALERLNYLRPLDLSDGIRSTCALRRDEAGASNVAQGLDAA